jgi:hypothetical protein
MVPHSADGQSTVSRGLATESCCRRTPKVSGRRPRRPYQRAKTPAVILFCQILESAM